MLQYELHPACVDVSELGDVSDIGQTFATMMQ